MQKRYRLSCFFVLSVFFALQAKSQTTCEKMVRFTNSMIEKAQNVTNAKPALSDADVTYLVDLCDENSRKLNSILGSETDGSVVRQYRFCKLEMNGRVASALMIAGKPDQVIYDLLNPLTKMVFALDIDVMNEHNYVTCVAADDAGSVVTGSDYQLYSVTYFYAYLRACFNLDKLADAETAYYHFRRLDFGVQEDAAYGVAALVVNYKKNTHTPDALMLDAATYMIDHFMSNYAYDSTQMTLGTLITVLNDPLLADTSVATRASDLYNLHLVLKVRTKYYTHYDLKDEMIDGLLVQAMHAMTSTSNIPALLGVMEYNKHSEIDSIMAMEDPVILQNVIAMAERYIARAGKLKEPWFWRNMVRLYTKAGNTNAAADAQKKYEKYVGKDSVIAE